MAGCARNQIVREGEIGVYHTWSRCVQRAYLCGDDPLTGVNYDYRRPWIQSLLEYQAGVFAVDIGNFAILSNHEHLICRTRPDLAAGWSDEEVAWRWKLAWPEWRDDHWARDPTDEQVAEVLADPGKLAKARKALSSLSWFMARWKEPIARLANRETDHRGHFWEQRFGSRELVDEAAMLTCSAYVDLNQVKAREAGSLEDSRYSAIAARIRAWRAEQARASVEEFHQARQEGYELETSDVEQLLADCWLMPITADGPLLLVADEPSRQPVERLVLRRSRRNGESRGEPGGWAAACGGRRAIVGATLNPPPSASPSERSPVSLELAAETQDTEPSTGRPRSSSGKSKPHQPSRTIHERLSRSRRRRASDQPFLSMPFEQYLEIVQWAADQLLAGQDRPPPPELASRLRDRQGGPGPLVRRGGPVPGVVSRRSRGVGRVGQASWRVPAAVGGKESATAAMSSRDARRAAD